MLSDFAQMFQSMQRFNQLPNETVVCPAHEYTLGNLAFAETVLEDKSAVENQPIYQHSKGVVKDNAVMALLHDKLFRQRVEKKRKGKGSYQRKAKYASNWFEKPDDKVFDFRNFIIGFFVSISV